MKIKVFFFLCCLILTTTILIYADSQESEIVLFEIVGESIIHSDNPLDNPSKGTENPTRPNQFHATISGRTLTISVDNDNLNTVIVRNHTGFVVVNQSFTNYNANELLSSGNYSIEITLSIYDIWGNEIKTITLQGESEEYEVQDLPKGLYIAKTKYDSQLFVVQ